MHKCLFEVHFTIKIMKPYINPYKVKHIHGMRVELENKSARHREL